MDDVRSEHVFESRSKKQTLTMILQAKIQPFWLAKTPNATLKSCVSEDHQLLQQQQQTSQSKSNVRVRRPDI